MASLTREASSDVIDVIFWHKAGRTSRHRSGDAATAKGIYVNMLNFDDPVHLVEAFGGPEKYARLGRVKAQYDPENITPVS